LQLLLTRTTVGLQMRAASLDFQTARLLGVRANRVIAGAVLVSGALAAVVAVMLTVQNPLVTPDFALQDTIVVLAGVVLGGLNRPIPATLGGFSIGFATGLLGGALPTAQSQYLPTFIFAAVILVLLVRPDGLFVRRPATERL
jgi:branched-chain amino acid transport system permease protein